MSCEFKEPMDLVKKLHEKGFQDDEMPIVHEMKCDCGELVKMNKFITVCPKCETRFAVTPCTAIDVNNVVKISKKDYII